MQGSQPNATVGAGAQDVYRLAAGVQGVLDVTLSADGSNAGNLNLSILGADGQTVSGVGPGRRPRAGRDGTAERPRHGGADPVPGGLRRQPEIEFGPFTLGFANLDQYEATGSQTLFIPTPGDPTSVRGGRPSAAPRPTCSTTNTDALDALTVLKGNGDGTFQAPQEYAVGPGLAGSLTADHREIGRGRPATADDPVDVAVPNFQAGDVSVLLGNGDGDVPAPAHLQRRAEPRLDGHRRLHGRRQHRPDRPGELHAGQPAVANSPSCSAAGDGTFEPPVLYSTVFTDGAGPMVVGDFTGNGHLDLIVFSKNEAFAEIFLGNGDGTFRPGTVFAVGENTLNAAAVDLTGNGMLDLITTGTNSGNVYVQMGNGNGTFGPPTAYRC